MREQFRAALVRVLGLVGLALKADQRRAERALAMAKQRVKRQEEDVAYQIRRLLKLRVAYDASLRVIRDLQAELSALKARSARLIPASEK